VLSPDRSYSPILLWVALAGLVVLLVVRAVNKDRREYQRFTRFERTRNRQRMMRRWLVGSLAMFGGSAVVLGALALQYIGPLLAAVHEWAPFRWFDSLVHDTGEFIPGIALGLGIVLVVGTVVAVYLARRSDTVPTIGDIGALLPRNLSELGYGAALSINAGIVEELLFRLAIPAALFGASGSALLAVGASVLLFGALHIYQGLPGILGAVIIGVFLMALYLLTGSIVVPIVVHALIDLRSLVLIPVLVYRVHRVR
jgi:membrane protease YdiL (CAAX protease family)